MRQAYAGPDSLRSRGYVTDRGISDALMTGDLERPTYVNLLADQSAAIRKQLKRIWVEEVDVMGRINGL